MDQSEDRPTSECHRPESNNETNQGQVSQTLSVATYQRSNSNPETTVSFEDNKLDVATLQRSASSPEVTSPGHIKREDWQQFQYTDSNSGGTILKETTHSFNEVDSNSVSMSPEHLRKDKLISGSSPEANFQCTINYGQGDLPVTPDHRQVDLPVKVKQEPVDDEQGFSQESSCPSCLVEKQSKVESEPFVCKLENEYLTAADDKKV